MSAQASIQSGQRPAVFRSGRRACQRQWTLRRNCCVSPLQFLAGIGTVAAGTVAVSAIMTARGVWMVLPFCAAELLALAVAALAFARHARDGEVVTLFEDGTLMVEVQQGAGVTRHVFNRAWVRLVCDGDAPRDRTLWLNYGGRRVRIARHIGYERLRAVEEDMRRALRGSGRPEASPSSPDIASGIAG